MAQTFAAALVAAAAAAAGAVPEEPAAPERFEVSLVAGTPLRGAAARIDIRYAGAATSPVVEVTFSASDDTRTWAAHVLAPPGFLQALKLKVPVSDRPLAPGQASVQTSAPGADVSLANAGSLQLLLRQGQLDGSYTSAADRGGTTLIRFAGPYVVSCSVPASALASHATAPVAAGDATGARIVDENFASALCKPYAALGGRR